MEDEKRITIVERRYFVGTNYRLGKYGYIVIRSMTDDVYPLYWATSQELSTDQNGIFLLTLSLIFSLYWETYFI